MARAYLGQPSRSAARQWASTSPRAAAMPLRPDAGGPRCIEAAAAAAQRTTVSLWFAPSLPSPLAPAFMLVRASRRLALATASLWLGR